MSATTPPQTLKGFRDFLPAEKRKRDFVAQRMREVFARHGFEPLETPTLEYASLLLGKYGDEADKLVYTFEDRGERQIGLRYDQTVPTARVLGQYQHELPRLFRRYQIQNVFRADKPQKGRFREFTQCDCDIFGSTDSLADAEILAVYYQAFANIGLTSIKIEYNDRQTLIATLSPFVTETVSVMSLIQTIDKLDKITPAEAEAELVSKGLSLAAAGEALRAIQQATPSDGLARSIAAAISLGVPETALIFNPTIARGLDYYTGLIFEGKIPEYAGGSVGGGGRYDHLLHDLTGLEMPAIGFGIGFDRTVEAADALGLIPADAAQTQVLVSVFDEAGQAASLEVTRLLRQAGIRTELYPASDKLGKQFKLADQKQIPYVIVIGEDERAAGRVMLKEMATGEQTAVVMDDLVEHLSGVLS